MTIGAVVLWLAAVACSGVGVSAYDNGMGRTAVMGWNTWCTDDLCGLVDLCFESEIKSIADAMVSSGMAALGYEYINLDDCWSATERDANGNLQPAPDQFPSGMKALADYIHSKGLKLGLYTDVGTETCKWGRPGAYGHYEQDANTLAAWGIDFVKADNCHRVGEDFPQYANYSRALNATGRPILFALCNWGIENVEQWAPSIAQQYRFQMDHLPFWSFGPYAQGVGYGQGTMEIIEFMATLPARQSSGPYGFMDPDFAETLMPVTMPFTESRTEFTFWTLWSSPLLIATDIRNMTAEKISIVMNPEVIAVDQDSLGIPGTRVFNHSDGSQLWTKPMSDGDMIGVLYNNGITSQSVMVNATWQQFGWNANAAVKVRDLWGRKDVGVFTGGYGAMIAPRDVFYFRATLQSTGYDASDDADRAEEADDEQSLPKVRII